MRISSRRRGRCALFSQGPCREHLTFRRRAFLSAFFQCLDFLHSQRAPGFLGARWPVASEVFFRGVSPKGRLSTAPGFLGAVLRHLTPHTAFLGHTTSCPLFCTARALPGFLGSALAIGPVGFFLWRISIVALRPVTQALAE